MNSQEKIKRWVGRCLLNFCDRFPRTKPLFRNPGLRTRKEWFDRRIVRVQLPDGQSFKLASVSENYLSFELFWRGTQYYEPITSLVLGELVRPGDTFIDVGANVGFYALLLSSVQPQCNVIAFEPNPKNYRLLRANVAANHLGRVTCEPLALSDADGPALLHLSASDMSASLHPDFDFHPTKTVEVPATTLDSYLARTQIQGPLVIKVDAEGHEESVLAGARRTLTSFHPDIITEVVLNYSQEAIALLREAGYRFYPITDQGLVESEALAPVVRDRLVFLNYLLSTRSPGEIAALFHRIEAAVSRIDLTQTSKYLGSLSLRQFKARQAAARPQTHPDLADWPD
jgi:FkbM family methyltransferase